MKESNKIETGQVFFLKKDPNHLVIILETKQRESYDDYLAYSFKLSEEIWLWGINIRNHYRLLCDIE